MWLIVSWGLALKVFIFDIFRGVNRGVLMCLFEGVVDGEATVWTMRGSVMKVALALFT